MRQITQTLFQMDDDYISRNLTAPTAETREEGKPISIRSTTDVSAAYLEPIIQRVKKSELEMTWRADPIVFNSANKIVQTIMSARHEIKAKDKKTQKFYDDFVENIGGKGVDTTWEELLKKTFLHGVIFGEGFIENIMNRAQTKIVDWDHLDPKAIDYAKDSNGNVIFDEKGKIKGYTMILPTNKEVPQNKKNAPAGIVLPANAFFINREKIAHVKLYSAGDGVYPIGLIEPIYKTTLRKLNMEEALANATYRHGFPTIVAELGDSVIGTRPTIVRINGEISIITFEELYDYVDAPEERRRHITIKECQNIETLSVNEKTKQIEWKNVRKISKHYYEKPLVILRQKWGETIVTDQHSVYDKELTLTKAGENPDLFAWRGDIPVQQEDKVILPDIVCKDSIYSKPKTRQIKELKGKELTSFLKIVGAYVSEGNVAYNKCGNKDSYQLQISNKKKEWLEELKKEIDSLFGLSGYIRLGENGCYSLRYSSKYLYLLFKQLCGHPAHNKTLPGWVFTLSKENKSVLLKWMIDGDGYVLGKNKIIGKFTEEYLSKQFEYSTVSEKLAAVVSLLLNTMGIDYSIKYMKTVKNRTLYNFRRVQRKRINLGKKCFERIEFGGYVYDLEVEDNHNFFDGVGMVLCHNTNHEPTPQQIQKMIEKLKDINFKQEIAVPYYYNLRILESKKAERLKEHLDYYKEQQIAGMGIPRPYATGTGSDENRAVLDNMSNLFQLTLRDIITSVVSSIRKQLFKPLSENYNLPSVPTIEWDLIGIDEWDKKARRLIEYIEKGVIPADMRVVDLIRKIENID
jgi:intein/homing endonuclease